MSDTWYREPASIPPYRDGWGNLWTWDGVCLNPVHTCEPPDWMNDLAILEFKAELAMSFQEAVEQQLRELMNVLTWLPAAARLGVPPRQRRQAGALPKLPLVSGAVPSRGAAPHGTADDLDRDGEG